MRRESPGGPDGPVGGFDPEPTAVLGSKDAVADPGRVVLPCVVGWGHGDLDGADGEAVADVVAGGGEDFRAHQGVDVAGGVESRGDRRELAARRDAVVIVVAVGDQNGVEAWHGVGG